MSAPEIPFLAGLDAPAVAAVRARMVPVAVPGGRTLFEQGDTGDALYTLVSGAVGVSARDHAGRPTRIARLRPPGEILEALDRAWREHWVVRQARQKGVALAGLNGDVVAERHVALNWLTGFQNDRDTPWDAIDTPT